MPKSKGAYRIACDAARFVQFNEARYATMKAMVTSMARAGQPISRDSIYTYALQHGMDINVASDFKCDHNLWAALIRFMALENPIICREYQFRESELDRIDLISVWQFFCGDTSHFQATSIKDARRLADKNV